MAKYVKGKWGNYKDKIVEVKGVVRVGTLKQQRKAKPLHL